MKNQLIIYKLMLKLNSKFAWIKSYMHEYNTLPSQKLYNASTLLHYLNTTDMKDSVPISDLQSIVVSYAINSHS